MKIACHGLDCDIRLSAPDLEGWMRATVSVKVPSFEGSFTCTIEQLEWRAFEEALRGLADSVGSDTQRAWGNMEENVGFTFALKKSGQMKGTYRFSPSDPGFGPSLTGPFEADQTYLQSWIRAASELAQNDR